MRVDDFLLRLNGVHKAGKQGSWNARCPCRDGDDNPSLSVAQGNNGNILVKCHYGDPCDEVEICEAMGLEVSDLFADDERPTKTGPVKVAEYNYVDESGVVLYQKVRYVDDRGKKTFRQRRPKDGGGYTYELAGVRRVLYNLPAVLAAKDAGQPVYLVEGEKDADTLMRLGCVATTNPDGAGSWSEEYTKVLAGMQVDVIADNDEPGMKHGKDVAARLKAAGCDVVLWRCPFHKDISDHLASGAKLEEIVQVDGEIEPYVEPVDVHAEAMDVLIDLVRAKSLSNSQKLLRIRMVAESVETEMPLDQGRLVNWEEFIKERDRVDYEWVIPGLLEIGERVIVVAAEGVGKTMLARQVALLSAAGVHPFAFQPMKPVRTLFVDLENPERIIKRMSRNIVDAINSQRKVDSRLWKGAIDAHLFMKPSGFDLLKASDRALLEKRMEEVKPQMVCLGPLYKAFVDPGGRTSEAIATEIAKYLDQLRTAFRCALWLEHHAPLGATGSTRELRPFGSAVWSRWPEFGLSLQPMLTEGPYTYEVRHFRGARDERPWPKKIVRGRKYPFDVVEYLEVGSVVTPLGRSPDDEEGQQ